MRAVRVIFRRVCSLVESGADLNVVLISEALEFRRRVGEGWFPANFMAWDLSLSTKNRSMCYCSYFAEGSRSVTLILDALHATMSTLPCMIKGMVHDSCSPMMP